MDYDARRVQMGVKFSVCLIARNEAPNLWRLNKSLKEFLARGGEVVLIDTGSSDGTPDIARGLGFSVYEVGEKFIFKIPPGMANTINNRFVAAGEEPIVKAGDKLFDYANARNYSARMATNDVVSMPDCDEQYTNLNIDAIEKVIDEGFQQMEFHFIFSHYPNGLPAVQFRQCKMYDRRVMNWQGIVHEVLVGNAKRTYLPPDVLLLEHFQAPQDHRSRYLPGLALDCYLHQDNDRNSHYLGRELIWNGHPKSAIQELTRHIKMNRWQQERGQSMIFIGDAYMMLGDEAKGLDSYHQAFLIDPTRRESLMRLADYFWRHNDPQKVACYCMAALEIPENDCYCNVAADYTFGPHAMLYWAKWWLGDREGSKYHWQKAIAYDPNNPKYIADGQFYEPERPRTGSPDTHEYKPNVSIDGWMTPGELEWLYKTARKMNSSLELGSWKGRSSHALLSGCKGKVTCVDTWKGSLDERDLTNSMAKQEDVFAVFKKNVGHFPNLEIMRMTGEEASAVCRAEGRKFDMVFIDAGHTYEEVKRDDECWHDLATVVYSGHDYLPNTWMGVCQAVDEKVGRTYKAESIWYVSAEPFPAMMGVYPDSLAQLQGKIEQGNPFSFVKYGDGEQQCMEGVEGATADKQPYSYEANVALRRAYNYIGSTEAYLTNWHDWREGEIDGRLLLHRENRNCQPQHDFYKAIRESNARKVFIGPAKLSGVCSMLGTTFIEVPEINSLFKHDEIWNKLKERLISGGIYLFSCGFLAKTLIAAALKEQPNATYIDTGSSFDPIFLGGTRTLQASQDYLYGLYKDMLPDKISTDIQARIPKRIFTIWLSEKEEYPPLVEKCIASQKDVKGYEHKVLTLADCTPADCPNPYIQAAIAAKRWVKAADYLRLWELRERGGIYCDADMEILPGKNFDSLLDNSFFICREENRFVANSLVGSEPNHHIIIEHLAEVEAKFKGDDNNVFEAAQEILTPRVYAAAASDPNVRILPPEWFIPYNHQTGVINVTDNTIAFHHFAKAWIKEGYTKDLLPRVAILIPSLGRPEGLARCLRSIDSLYYPKHLVRIVVDEGEGTVPVKVNRMYRSAKDSADIFLYAANDVEFTDPWCLYRAVKTSSYSHGAAVDTNPFISKEEGKGYGLVSLNAGTVYADFGNICEHFLITKDLVEKLGEIFSEKLHHVGVDNLLWAKASKLGEASRCEEAKITHHHFSKGENMDWVYQQGWSKVNEDRAILKAELEKLKDQQQTNLESPEEKLPSEFLWTVNPPKKALGRYPKSIAEWQEKIESGEPFSFVKYGDGEQQCMENVEGATCDGQPYSYEANIALRRAYSHLLTLSNVYLAFWRDTSYYLDGNFYQGPLGLGNGNEGRILLHQDSSNQPLHHFYKSIRNSARLKVFVGPKRLQGVTDMLKTDFVEVPEKDAFSESNDIFLTLLPKIKADGIYLFSCGLLAKVLISNVLKKCPDVTCLDTGSSFDPIFVGETRVPQASREDLAKLYFDMLP